MAEASNVATVWCKPSLVLCIAVDVLRTVSDASIMFSSGFGRTATAFAMLNGLQNDEYGSQPLLKTREEGHSMLTRSPLRRHGRR